MSKNDVTGDSLVSRVSSKEYRDGYSGIWRKKWLVTVKFFDGDDLAFEFMADSRRQAFQHAVSVCGDRFHEIRDVLTEEI